MRRTAEIEREEQEIVAWLEAERGQDPLLPLDEAFPPEPGEDDE